jgi:hypothetical protein
MHTIRRTRPLPLSATTIPDCDKEIETGLEKRAAAPNPFA